MEQLIRQQWLNMITISPENQRITDYAVQLVDMLREYRPQFYSSTENTNIQAWMRRVYNFLHQESFVVKRFTNSNWHGYRLWVMSHIAIILRLTTNITFLRRELITYIQVSLAQFPIGHVNYGALIDFVHRDSISYQVYTMFAILNAITTLETEFNQLTTGQTNTHTELWRTDTSLRQHIQPAIRYVLPYLRGTKIHMEFVKSQVSSDSSRSDFNKPFDPRTGTYLYTFMMNNNFV